MTRLHGGSGISHQENQTNCLHIQCEGCGRTGATLYTDEPIDVKYKVNNEGVSNIINWAVSQRLFIFLSRPALLCLVFLLFSPRHSSPTLGELGSLSTNQSMLLKQTEHWISVTVKWTIHNANTTLQHAAEISEIFWPRVELFGKNWLSIGFRGNYYIVQIVYFFNET